MHAAVKPLFLILVFIIASTFHRGYSSFDKMHSAQTRCVEHYERVKRESECTINNKMYSISPPLDEYLLYSELHSILAIANILSHKSLYGTAKIV